MKKNNKNFKYLKNSYNKTNYYNYFFMQFYRNNQLSISNTLIGISIIVTILATIVPSFYQFGMNTYFLDRGIYHIYIIQFFTSNFLHGGILHLMMNSLFLYIFGNMVEIMLGRNKYILFFLFVTFFNGVAITEFASGNTIGISGFAMALMAYYTLDLKSKNNPEYKGGITALIINVGIGLAPGISLVGHLFGAIAGVIFYLLNKDFFRRVMTFIKS